MQPSPPPTAQAFAPLPEGVRRDVPLAPFTTLGVGGPADYFATAQSVAQLQSLLKWARQRALPVLVLGEGSNVVVHDSGVRGLTLRYQPIHAQAVLAAERGHPVVLCGGAPWSDTVRRVSDMGLFGIEALHGIPGTCGAAPIQNIGAYGQDISQTLTAVEVLERETGDRHTLSAAQCGLAYRYSHLRGPQAGRYVVTAVHMALGQNRARPLTYPALVQGLERQGLDPTQATPAQVCEAVWQVRAARGMVWRPEQAPFGTVGSFFTNPTVPNAVAQALLHQHPTMPHWPGPQGCKLSAAWLIEAAGFAKGWRCPRSQGRVGLSPLHALALVNLGGATAEELCSAAAAIYSAVRERLGVELTAEAQRIGFEAAVAPFV